MLEHSNPGRTPGLMDHQAQGELVARQIFPETTIVRPAPLFGFEDCLLHRLASVTNLFTTNHMKERFNPVHVRKPEISTKKCPV